jgi:integrase/recombinase XerD
MLKAPRSAERPSRSFALDDATFQQILVAVGRWPLRRRRNCAILHFLWPPGLRVEERAALTPDTVHLEERSATIRGKGDKERLAFFDEGCKEELERWLEDRKTYPQRPEVRAPFLNVDEVGLSTGRIRETLEQACQDAKLEKKIRPHIFRHSRITLLLDRGMALQEVAANAGHSKINATAGYWHGDLAQPKSPYDAAMQRGEKVKGVRTSTGQVEHEAQRSEAGQPDNR